MEEIKFLLDTAAESMQSAVDHTSKTFSKFRAGKASASMLDGIQVDQRPTLRNPKHSPSDPCRPGAS